MRFDISSVKFGKPDLDKGIFLPQEMTTDLAEEIGLHLGDGSMNFYSNKGLFQLRGHINDDKKHYLSRIRPLYKKLYNLDVNLREMPSSGVVGFQVWSDAMVSFKKKVLNLPLGPKNEIGIPSLINNNELFFSFMKGLFDTDGSLHIENKRGKPYPRIDIKTTSRRLCLQIHRLLNEKGIRATYYKYKRKEKNWKDLYSIIVRGFVPIRKWFEHIGSNNPKHIEKFKTLEKNNGPAVI